LSTESSPTPGVTIRPRPSARRAQLGTAWHGLALVAAACLVTRGHSVVAALFLTYWLVAARWQGRHATRLRRLHWTTGGGWHCDTGEGDVPVQLLPGCLCLPGAVYLRWRSLPAGSRCATWLLSDSCDPGQWHRLRQAMRLQG
jgi:hypothetical protein